jgi:serine protease Do
VEKTEMPFTGFGEVAERLRRSTVVVRGSLRGGGSGVIVSGDGLIATNAHVLNRRRISVQLWDGRELEASIVRMDRLRDLAALRIWAADPPAAVLADSSQVRAGELALAVGNPLGFVGALSTGVIHAVGPLPGLGSTSWVQASLRLAPGNSGGPLANVLGDVVGINSMVAGQLALAIPSNTVKSFLAGCASSAWLGVAVSPVQVPGCGSGHFGLLILEIAEGSPAALASLLPGDTLLGTEERRFVAVEDLRTLLQGVGERQARFEFLRGDYANVRKVTVLFGGAKPDERPEAA